MRDLSPEAEEALKVYHAGFEDGWNAAMDEARRGLPLDSAAAADLASERDPS